MDKLERKTQIAIAELISTFPFEIMFLYYWNLFVFFQIGIRLKSSKIEDLDQATEDLESANRNIDLADDDIDD